MAPTANGDAGTTVDLDVLVIGGGFGGCYLLKLLRENGYSTRTVEAAPRLGGVWAWNRYPGARVDVEVPWYGFSHPEIWGSWTWKERYPSDSTLREYFDHVAKVWDLNKDVELNTRVTQARFEEGNGKTGSGWVVETAGGKTYRCKWLIPATGTSFKQYFPEWKNRDLFKGIIAHSSLWPENVDLTGKRVAIIGAGSTGIQVMQEAAKVASHVTQYIRTPNLAIPMRQREVSEDEILAHRPTYPHVFRAIKKTNSGLPTEGNGMKTFDVSDEERKRLWEQGWKRGGFNWSIGGFGDIILDPKANRAAYDFWRSKISARIKDPKKRELLAPVEPPYYLGTKRPSLEQDYYEMCDRDNVEITNSPIRAFTESGIVTDEKETAFDIVAICTGYDAVTGGLRTMGIKGKGGQDLDDKWANGVSTHLGMMVNGFPNMYFVYGPQAPTSLTNGPPFLELQAEWIVDAINQQRDQKLDAVEAKQSEEDKWKEGVLAMADMTLAIHTNSWYMGANVPGKRREYLLYLGGLPRWHAACVDALQDWKGFDVGAAV